ncbi:class I SAM-dependent methyltransferase [Paradesertivirga mongoliensis]|uniref:Class I SAM-dependent methyltransferase n=1 Tax=Paradesertivirga mongoliensis TaxID=2100740 RepID=A0ABW4ZRA0_9SPHI|nr:class I SAM-dependent methyltransferase [Pedobacter mongoliensis]
MNSNIIKPEVQRFLEKYLKDDVNRIALSKSPFVEVSARELAEQLDGKQRSQKKLPLWFSTPEIVFPAKLSIEQSSSEVTAGYKSNLLKGDKVIDLTGGFGVDCFYFSKKAKEVIHCEKNTELSQIAQHNLSVLGATNIRFVNHDSLLYLQSTEEIFDTIYIDPSRRIENKKVFLLKDTEPDVVSHLQLFLSKATRIIIKTSPLFDIQSGLKELSNVSEVHVVSVKNDCKELLWIIDRDFTAEPEISCVALSDADQRLFNFKLSEEKNADSGPFSEPLGYLYEPNVALLKAGCFKSIAARFPILKLQTNTHLYTSEVLVPDFIGRVFKVKAVYDYKTFIKQNTIRKANVITRNFPHAPEELKKKHKINDGGDEFLIFTTVYPDKLKVISATINQ